MSVSYSIVQKSQLEGGQRLDAEYYQPEYLEVAKKLSKLPHQTLEDISESLLSFGAYSLTNQIVWEDSGIPFVTAENIKEGMIDFNNIRYINDKVDEILKKSRVHEGEVLLAMSGKVGDAAVADNIPQKLNSNQDVVKIRLKAGYSPYCLAVFLNSRFGRSQILRLPVGSVQQHIFLWQTKSILVPTLSDDLSLEIENLYKESSNKLERSQLFYLQAENLLLEELGLKEFRIENEMSYVVNLSDIKSANRVDAEHFQPKYDRLIAKIKAQSMQPFTKAIENVPARFNPATKPDTIFRYVELADINGSIGIIDGCSDVLGKEAPSRAKRILERGNVVVSSIEGSLEKVALVDNDQDGYLASTGFFQFRSKELLPEVILVLAKSIVMQWQLQKYCAGTILTAVPGDSLQKMFVPIISEPTQQKIADLVHRSHDARKMSKELLEEAKRKVEEMIEKRAIVLNHE